MNKNLKQRLKDGEAVHGCWLNMGSSISAEIIGSAGFDWTLIDLEHGIGTESNLIYQLQALEGSGATPIVRSESLEVARVKRVLDIGASGIMFPQIQNAEEARLAISNMYYPPKGRRGLAKMIRATSYGTNFDNYFNAVAENLLGVIQIETIESLKHLDEIAAIDGVDVLFLGPADLSLALGIQGQWDHPDFISTVEAIGKAARQAGKAAGVLFFDVDQYDFYYNNGFRFLASGSDMVFVSQGAKALSSSLSKCKNRIQGKIIKYINMEKIGFIGLGIMGKPMSIHLLKAGYQVTVLKSSGAADVLSNEGARLAENPKVLAEDSDIVITCVPDSPEVESLVLGEQGVAAGVSEGNLFIDMSTISPATTAKIYKVLAEKGVEALDAPVSGGEGGAKSASLSIMVGGTQAAFDRAMPVFEKMGKNIVRIGESGAGQVTKACNQVVVGLTIQAVAEALNLAKKAGVDVARVREALLGGFAQSRIMDIHGQRFLDGNYQPGFKVKLHRKDMNIALQTGKDLSVPLPGSSLVAAQMDALIGSGSADLDHSALALLIGQLSGME